VTWQPEERGIIAARFAERMLFGVVERGFEFSSDRERVAPEIGALRARHPILHLAP
jgi:hypothetical protein